MKTLRYLVPFLAGILFALGLGLSGMTLPERVIGFLDVFGQWDPSLVFVMGGAAAVYFVVYRLVRRRPKPMLAPRFYLPTRTEIDGRLVGGAALFGVGWGLGGLCPGPALTSLAGGAVEVFFFVGAMATGMVLHGVVDGWLSRSAPRSIPSVDVATQ